MEVTDFGTTQAATLLQSASGIEEVIKNCVLEYPWSVTFQFPPGMTYRAGEYLAIVPTILQDRPEGHHTA